jgi:hypothetical protein
MSDAQRLSVAAWLPPLGSLLLAGGSRFASLDDAVVALLEVKTRSWLPDVLRGRAAIPWGDLHAMTQLDLIAGVEAGLDAPDDVRRARQSALLELQRLATDRVFTAADSSTESAGVIRSLRVAARSAAAFLLP